MGDIQYGHPLRITELKAVDDAFEVAGYVSTYGNMDHGGDVVLHGAFEQTLSNKAPVRFLFGHDTHQVLGKPIELRSDNTGLFGRFKISQTQLGRDVHTLLKDGALDSFSIGYIPTDVEFDESGARLLKGIDLLECSVVSMPMNTRATVTAVKADDVEDKATWSTSYINDLPDSAFAAIESGGKKDAEGKTVPRSLRHYPHHDKSGKVDEPHLNAALSRVGDSSNYQGGKAHLQKHKGGDSKVEDLLPLDDDCSFEDLLGQVAHHIRFAAEAAEALQARRAEDGRKLSSAHIDAITSLLNKAEADFERMEEIANPPPPDDGMKLRLDLARRLESKRARALLETKT